MRSCVPGLELLVFTLTCFLQLQSIAGEVQVKQDCKTAWECCKYIQGTDDFNQCCAYHGCCPNCGQVWQDGCCFNKKSHSFGTVLKRLPEICIQIVCAAEGLDEFPYLKATVLPVFYDPGPLYKPHCQAILNTKCIDKTGMVRSEGAEWFESFTCEQCKCLKGKIECIPVKRPCPPPPHPDCVVKGGGCCPQWDCGQSQLDAAECMSSDGTNYYYGQTWWDKKNPCIYNKCTEKGILHYKKDCSKLPPPPNPSCKLVKPDLECCEKWKCSLSSRCPDPSSFGRVCIQYIDQCKYDKDCKTGYSCCLVAGCGHECVSLQCPDPNSFGRNCFQYFDQCKTNQECPAGYSCCLVAGCGHECVKSCKDSSGVLYNIGHKWIDPITKKELTCSADGIHPTTGSLDQPPETVLPTEREPLTPTRTLADCLSSGINFTKIANDLLALNNLSLKFPFKDPSHYLTGYRHLLRERVSAESFSSAEIQIIQSFAQKFNWSSVITLLNINTTQLQVFALTAGDRDLQIKNVVTQAIAERNDSLPLDSPSAKHQVAFRRTDPIATQMAQLGAVIEIATTEFVRSVNIPTSAANALQILGEISDCSSRFKAFLRPQLSLPCDPKNTFRTLDGTCNNLNNDLWGAAFTRFRRILPPAYGDGISTMRRAAGGGELPSARLVSSKVNTKNNVESPNLSSFHVTYAQFLDHDLTATPISKGYLGGSIKCCDDLRVELDLAVNTLNSTQKVIQQIKLTEPTLATNKTLGTLEATLNALLNLKVNGETFFTNVTNVSQALHIAQQSIAIPIRPQNAECAPISIPPDDPFYSCYGKTCMEFVRSAPAPSCTFGPREQLNQHSAYLDGSVIYGVKRESTDALRSFSDGLLKMKVTQDKVELLPAEENKDDGCNTPDNFNNGIYCFKAGDGRVNEQLMLAVIQTVWAREHNRVAKILKNLNNPGWDDERLFQEARRIVVAELQHVTYREFLPNVLGSLIMNVLQMDPLYGDQYTTDYDETLDASIANSFATAAYRYGHSQINDFVQKVNRHGLLQTDPLSTLFFNPYSLYGKETMEDLTRGSTSHSAKKVDAYFTEEITGKLFRGNLPYGLDLVAVNLQRGRDHGLPGYIEYKALCGSPAKSFSDLHAVMDEEIVEKLQEVYKKVEDIDLFIGAIAERPFLDGILGPTFNCIVADQFFRIKRGDRFWYEYKDGPGAFTAPQLREIRRVTLARILCNNIPELTTIQREPFKTLAVGNPRAPCSSYIIPKYSLDPWRV